MQKALFRWLFLSVVVFLFTACGGGGKSPTVTDTNLSEKIEDKNSSKDDIPKQAKDENISEVIDDTLIDKNSSKVEEIKSDDNIYNSDIKEDSQKSIISGYVVDDPIEKATIELQEINGTLIQRFESVTNADGSYSIKIDEKYKNKDFILRAYNGTISNKAFDGDLYGYHLSGDDLEINLTPLNTMLLTLSSEFSDTDFSARLAKAKDLLSATYGIREDEFSSIKDSDFSNFDIVKFRELVSSIGFNGLVQSLVADSIDGYADKNNSKLLFISAKQRVLKDAKTNFAIVDTNLGSDEVSKLTIRGVSEKEDGTTGTMDMLTDVIATKTDTDDNNVTKETIVFRSFNVGKWKGKLNEETTLLARIFMDYRLTNLTPSVQESIATKLLKERADDFQNAIKYQDMATDVPFAYPYYIELMEGLRVFALSYISNFSIAQTDKVGVTLSKFSKFVQHQRKYRIKKNNRISIGLLEVEITENALAFANYAKVNYGLRAYEIDGVKQDYDYPFWDFNINIIKPVEGGAIGGLYDYMRNKLKFTAGTTILYDNKLLGEDRLLNNISKVKLEMYKWQGSYPTLLNVADGFQIVGNTFNIFKGDISQKIKDKFKNAKVTYSKVKKYALYIDMAVESLNMVVDSYAWIAKQYQGTNKLENIFSKDFIKLKDSTNKAYTRVAGILKTVDTLINTEGYSIPNKIDAKKMKVDFGLKKVLLTDVPNYIYTDEKKVSKDNGFSTRMSNFLKTIKYDKEKSFRLALKDKVRLLSKFNSIIVQGEIEKIIKKQIAQGKIEKGKSDIDNFNTKYGKYFSFKQMHYVISYIVFSEDKINASNIIRKKIAIRESTFSKAIADYSKIMLGYMGNGIKKVGTFDITGLLKASLKSTEGKSKDLEILKDMFSGAANIGKKDPTELFKASAKFMIETLDGDIKTAASNVLKNIMVNLFGGGYAKLGIAANDITSYVAGNFLTPNKQYLELNKDGDKVSIKRPPLTLVGLDSSHISNIESYDISIKFHDIVKKYTNNFLNKKVINNSYLVTLDKDYSVSYVPHYDVIVSQTRASKFNNMLDNAIFPNNTFMKFDFNIEKSNNNKIDGSFEKNKKLSFENIVITVDNMKKVTVEEGENDLYSFNTMEAWGHKLGDFNKYVYMVLPNTQRGIFRESINVQLFQPKSTKDEYIMPKELYMKQQSLKNYIYLATTGKTLGKNLIIEKVVRAGYDYLRVENKNSFDIYFEAQYDYKDNGLFQSDERGMLQADYKVDKNSVYLLPMLGLKDDKGNYNDVEFNFYDGIAEDFFKNNGFAEPRLSNYLAVNNKDSSLVKASEILVYNIKLDDIIKIDNYLMITSYGNGTQTESTLSDNGEVNIEFNMPLSSDSINKIKVYDVDEKRYLNSDDYTVTHTSGNEYLITIKNYRNHHEYKLVFPSDLTSESGAKLVKEREISNFIYNNKKPIANAGADQTITSDEIEDFKLDGSASYDPDGTIVKMEWFYKDKLVWDGDTFPLKTLNISENEYILKLIVTDEEEDKSSDIVTITIKREINDINITYQGINTYRTFIDARTDLKEVISTTKRYDNLLFIGTENGKIILVDTNTLEEKSKVLIDVPEFSYIDAKVSHFYKKDEYLYVGLTVVSSNISEPAEYIVKYKMKDNHIHSLEKLYTIPVDYHGISGMYIRDNYLYITCGGRLGSFDLSKNPVEEISFSWLYPRATSGLCGIDDNVYFNHGSINHYKIDNGKLIEHNKTNGVVRMCQDSKLIIYDDNKYGLLDKNLEPLVMSEGYSNSGKAITVKDSHAYTLSYYYNKDESTCDLYGLDINLKDNIISNILELISSEVTGYHGYACKEYHLIGNTFQYNGLYILDFNGHNGRIGKYNLELEQNNFSVATTGNIKDISKNNQGIYIAFDNKIVNIIDDTSYKTIFDNFMKGTDSHFDFFKVNNTNALLKVHSADYYYTASNIASYYHSDNRLLKLYSINKDKFNLIREDEKGDKDMYRFCKDTFIANSKGYYTSYNKYVYDYNFQYIGTIYDATVICNDNGFYNYRDKKLQKLLLEDKSYNKSDAIFEKEDYYYISSYSKNNISFISKEVDGTSYIFDTLTNTTRELIYGEDFPFKYYKYNKKIRIFTLYDEVGNKLREVNTSCGFPNLDNIFEYNKRLWINNGDIYQFKLD